MKTVRPTHGDPGLRTCMQSPDADFDRRQRWYIRNSLPNI